MLINKIEIAGIKELEAQLRTLGQTVRDRIADEAVRGPAEAFRDKAVLAAPYGDGRLKFSTDQYGGVTARDYGHLRDNIKVRKVKARNEGYTAYRVTTGRAFWGYFLEYGTIKMAARPWWRPTMDAFHPTRQAMTIAIFRKGVADALAGKSIKKGFSQMSQEGE